MLGWPCNTCLNLNMLQHMHKLFWWPTLSIPVGGRSSFSRTGAPPLSALCSLALREEQGTVLSSYWAKQTQLSSFLIFQKQSNTPSTSYDIVQLSLYPCCSDSFLPQTWCFYGTDDMGSVPPQSSLLPACVQWRTSRWPPPPQKKTWYCRGACPCFSKPNNALGIKIKIWQPGGLPHLLGASAWVDPQLARLHSGCQLVDRLKRKNGYKIVQKFIFNIIIGGSACSGSRFCPFVKRGGKKTGAEPYGQLRLRRFLQIN